MQLDYQHWSLNIGKICSRRVQILAEFFPDESLDSDANPSYNFDSNCDSRSSSIDNNDDSFLDPTLVKIELHLMRMLITLA